MSNFVQGASGTYSTTTLQTLAYGSNNTLGNALVAFVSYSGNTDPTALTDTNLNSWNKIAFQPDAASGQMSIWVALNCAAGANTVAVHIASTNVGLCIAEYNTVTSGVDQYNSGDSSSSSWNSAAITTLYNTETIIAASAGGAGMMAIGSPFTQRETVSGGGTTYAAFGDMDVLSTGTYSAPFTQGSNSNEGNIIISLYTGSPAVVSTGVQVIFMGW